MILKNLLYVSLLLSLSFFLYWLIRVLIELKKRNFIGNFFESFNKKYEKRKIEEEAQKLYEGDVEKKDFISNIDNLIQSSGIRKVFRNLTAEILITSTLLIAIIIAMFTNLISHFWFYDSVAFVLTIAAIFFILKFMERIEFNKIDNHLLTYINILKNLSLTNTDIVIIFEKSIPYAKEPLKTCIKQFVFESKSGIGLEKSFKNFENSIENNRFKQLLKNLYVASKHTANYRQVINSSKVIFKNYFSEKRRKMSNLMHGSIGILVITVLGIITFYISSTFIGTNNIFLTLRLTPIGNALLIYFLLILIFMIVKLINLNKFND